jgi:hypothetical protein
LDFILVSVPMVLLTLSVIGIAINGFAKNVALDIAVDTARFAALADQDAVTASDRALKHLRAVLAGSFSPNVVVSRADSSESCSYEVQVTLHPLTLGFMSGILPIRETARAVCELQG